VHDIAEQTEHDNAEPYISVQAEQCMAVKNSACQCRPRHHGAQMGHVAVHAGKCIVIRKFQKQAIFSHQHWMQLVTSKQWYHTVSQRFGFFTAQREVAYFYIIFVVNAFKKDLFFQPIPSA
jgi:hypothetical protein